VVSKRHDTRYGFVIHQAAVAHRTLNDIALAVIDRSIRFGQYAN
jgi:hypothetical protein